MWRLQLSFLLSLAAMALLALTRRRPYVDEFGRRWRQTVAAFLLIAILAVAVFFPVTSFGEAEDIDVELLWFPSLFLGHFLLAGFLLSWWWLRHDLRFGAFLHLSSGDLWGKVRHGLRVGCGGWLVTVMVTSLAAGATAATGKMSAPAEAPPIIVWLVELPLVYRLIIVAVAMTVEEAFFRGFLQPRFGLVVSSIMFALSHFSYGLPFMIVGVFTISLVIGRTFQRSGDLLPCIVAHGIFDAVQLLVVLPWAVHVWGTGVVG
ncbi:MAG TPA: type II CAAX endopeptidase family protein [Candidatus Margulisiibacteriota bacterium]|nr:type II CAAX endopeptidase family protein [Candidatus Margulisiibacteriota bacterium]